ncbi:monofunctional biosynthetic peptidoglycan transglycosylase [Parapedomonas caeni]
MTDTDEDSPTRPLFKRLSGVLISALLIVVGLSVLWVAAYRWIDPPTTWLIHRDRAGGKAVQQTWTTLDDMQLRIGYAAIAAEDARFCDHHGFDVEAITRAMEANVEGKKLRGGSTISQQVAKNVFLWPERSWVRKGLEAYFTVLIELFWSKRRIMEVYLNVAEWGDGIYGAEAASRHYFHKSAAKLSRTEAARLVSILPSPKKWSPTDPSKRVKRKARNVRKALATVMDDVGKCLRND